MSKEEVLKTIIALLKVITSERKPLLASPEGDDDPDHWSFYQSRQKQKSRLWSIDNISTFLQVSTRTR